MTEQLAADVDAVPGEITEVIEEIDAFIEAEIRPLESTTRGRLPRDTPNSSAISSLHAPRPMSNRSVREALEASVTWSRPADRRAMSQESTVPAAASATPATLLIAHASLVAVKYGSRTRPVVSRTRCS